MQNTGNLSPGSWTPRRIFVVLVAILCFVALFPTLFELNSGLSQPGGASATLQLFTPEFCDAQATTIVDPPVTYSPPLPIVYFTSSDFNSTVIGPSDQPVLVTRRGRFLGTGNYVFSYSVPETGDYKIISPAKEAESGSGVVDTVRLHPDNCVCPEDFPVFEQRYRCSAEDDEWVSEQFGRFQPSSVSNATFHSFNGRYTMRASIINNTLFHTPPNGGGWQDQFFKLIKAVLRKVRIPDVEFYVNFHDGPACGPSYDPALVFSFTKTALHCDIAIPSGQHIEEGLFGGSLFLATKAKPWKERIPKAFFRGTNTGYPTHSRDRLLLNPRWHAAYISAQRPDLLDIKVHAGHPGPISKDVSDYASLLRLSDGFRPPEEALKHKYVAVLDGNTATWRFSTMLLTGTVLLKQHSAFEEYFYSGLKSGEHFIEIQQHLGDLVKQVEDLRQQDSKAEQIAKAAHQFALKRLSPSSMLCYMAKVLQRTREVMAFAPAVRPGMKEAGQPPCAHSCAFPKTSVS